MKNKSLITLSLCLILCLLFGCKPKQTESDCKTFTFSFITIGKGDCFVLQTPKGGNYLVDTGKTEDFFQIAGLLKLKNISNLDGIFLTHGHKDHAGGLDKLMSEFSTKAIYLSATDTVTYKEIDPQKIAKKHGADVCNLTCGQVLDLGGVTAEVWLPAEPDTKEPNNNSVILRITHKNKIFLLMGDAELEEEAEFISSQTNLKADLLKLGHHGEKDSTSKEFLEKVKPQYGIITGNITENPASVNEKISGYLKEYNLEYFYSECEGAAIDFISDGEQISVKTINTVN